jgi:hypothetical protein
MCVCVCVCEDTQICQRKILWQVWWIFSDTSEEDTQTSLRKILRYVRGTYSDKSEEDSPIRQRKILRQVWGRYYDMSEEDTQKSLRKILRYVRGTHPDVSEEETDNSWASLMVCYAVWIRHHNWCSYVMVLCSFLQCDRMVMQEAGKGFTLPERNCGMSLNLTNGEIRTRM